MLLTGLSILGPELLFAVALNQRLSANRSVSDFRALLDGQELQYQSYKVTHKHESDEECGLVQHLTGATVTPSASSRMRHYANVMKGCVRKIASGIRDASWRNAAGESQKPEPAWSLTHAFFADAGGFHLRDRKGTTVPLNARQLFFLVYNGYVPKPTVARQHIEDKNKADYVLRYYWLAHITWFCITTLVRWQQRLPTTTLELTTFTFAICATLSSLLRMQKPSDIRSPEIIDTAYTIEEICRRHGQTGRAFRYSPFDFVSHEEWHWSRLWRGWVNLARVVFWYMPGDMFEPCQDRIGNTYSYPVRGKMYNFMVAVIMAYACVFLATWNHDFAMPVQRALWRASVLSMMITFVLYEVVQRVALDYWPYWRQRSPAFARLADDVSSILCLDYVSHPSIDLVKALAGRAAAWFRNNSPNADPDLAMPLKFVLPTYVLVITYGLGRCMLWTLDLWELGSLPEGAYERIHWPALFEGT